MNMNDKELLEELWIKKAASLADTKAPLRQDTERARNFVRSTLGETSRGNTSRQGVFSVLFSRPAYAWGGIGALACASLALILFLSPARSSGGRQAINPAMTSVHASADSLGTTADTLSVEDECIEIIAVE